MRIAIVDGYTSGGFLASELAARGAQCVHVRSRASFDPRVANNFEPSHYIMDLGHHPDPEVSAARLLALGVDRVVAGAESGVRLADRLAAATGAPGNDPGLTGARRDKQLMRDTVAAAGLDAPRGIAATEEAEAVDWFTASGLPSVVVKPADSAGSDRVRFCRTVSEVVAACREVLGVGNIYGDPDTTAIVQETLTGPELYLNTVSVDGRHHVVETWRYVKGRSPIGSPVFDHEELLDPAAPTVVAAGEYLCRALTALGVTVGPSHCELVVTERGPVLIDAGIRLGGGVLPWVSQKLLGHSHVELFASAILDPAGFGAIAAGLPLRADRPVRYVSLINRVPGRVADLDWVDRLHSLPTTVAVHPAVRPGAELPVTHDLFSSPGFVYLSGESRDDVLADHRRIRDWERDGLYTGGIG